MWGFVRGDDPPAGWLYTSGPPLGFTVAGGAYVTIQASSADLLLAAARALEPAH
jgi:hypothetical protein